LIYLFSIFNIETADPMSGYFLFNKKVYTKNKKNLFGKGFKILADFLINSKDELKTRDYYIKFRRRYGDKSKMNIKILLILVQFYLLNLFRIKN
jgi:dolichol-phosphate mannosyltransferase